MTLARLLLLTGLPGAGKTTVVRRVADSLGDRVARGFTTEELREEGARVGFSVVDLDGRRGQLARISFPSRHRVGRYGVDLESFERLALPALAFDPRVQLYLIDEIGKMECLSPNFVAAVERLLASEVTMVATVARRGGGLIATVKERPDADLWEVTPSNREAMPGKVLDWLGRLA